MKNNSIKILLIIMAILQFGTGLKSMIIGAPLFLNGGETNISLFDKAIVACFIIISVLFTIAAFILAHSNTKAQQYLKSETITKSETKDKSEQKKQIEEEKKRIQLLNEKKKTIANELAKDLNLSEGIQMYSEKVLINISKQFNIMQGLFYLKDKQDKVYRKAGTYAYYSQEDLREFTDEIGLSGQVASNKKLLNISNIPDKYLTVHSGLGHSAPANLVIFPILNKNESIGIIELASFVKFDSFAEEVLMELSVLIGNQLSSLNIEQTNANNL